MPTSTEVTIHGRHLALSNLDKVLYPKSGFTKGEVIDYYVRVSSVLLPHLRDRALTLKRYPKGIDQEFFYEKRCPSFRPDWVKTAPVWSETHQEKIPFCLVNDVESLVWAANLADLELHTSLAKYKNPDRPTMMVFDLDPGEGANIINCAQVALWVHDYLSAQTLKSFPKTSGSKGMQVYVPLNTVVTYEQTKHFAHALAEYLAEKHPDAIVSNMKKVLRKGKVFIDWSQNDRHKTTVCVYSLRAKEPPGVSTPLKWDEVKAGLDRADPKRFLFEPEQALKRFSKMGDLFKPVLQLKQTLRNGH